MRDRLTELWADKKKRGLYLLAGGMVGITTGAKAIPLAMFAAGLKELEDEWRRAHPEFDGGMSERWDAAIRFYDATHQDPVNRALHTIGIPMIVGGAAGMLAAPRWTPPWWIANASWTTGWLLNFVGHGAFEKAAPAFADDPLSFVAGPVWDFLRLRDKALGRRPEAESERAPDAPVRASA